ncbi:uncharacterized SAM-binding protein YcdF (DUF218 family) [Rhizomicrobium palustre]|uniref:Uncharacterized SAM-binding protein YcdF (DUF218 family) n=1 Tax=Rhizomicrobium palustre TaxID=189966 RepID=A0A846MZE2_9PROT|nr:YdcF family protein [Rhizomicrobium palustre]NIK88605.1 uncharacterized SAM-binding protein YcdF (DUF218 family) [Rhizomicrobium palustre]
MRKFGPFVGVAPEDVDAINAIAAFLALEDDPAEAAEVVVLAGNAMLWTLEGAVEKALALGAPLLLSGGEGHSTRLLQAAIAAHPLYGHLQSSGHSEARLLHDLAVEFLGMPADQILVEARSTNCSENANFSKALLDDRGIHPSQLLLIQDPLMQRRTDACFRRAFEGGGRTSIINWPVWRPQVMDAGQDVIFRNPPNSNMWSPQRFLELLLGEIPRLRDDDSGYGPRGKGFIPHIDIPSTVEEAFDHLTCCGRFVAATNRLIR